MGNPPSPLSPLPPLPSTAVIIPVCRQTPSAQPLCPGGSSDIASGLAMGTVFSLIPSPTSPIFSDFLFLLSFFIFWRDQMSSRSQI